MSGTAPTYNVVAAGILDEVMAVVSSSAWDTKFLLVRACVAAWGCLDHSWTPGFLNFCDAFEAVFPVAQVKNPPTMQETLVQFLGQEDPLEKGTATHSSTLAWRILWTEEPGEL